ncbi:hypothetical protein KBI5_24510 [Frankia sp. KB5]|uniref:Uncharacterized protein n=1 Tax=Frankia casuarinae (strain DSM 45818 / CECT 9043 / HFP020203 / CcI3) TaxID=106370 RepID=Q2JH19_FRACC|nr:hypothetical protein Francci3_0029 [Frankia casuarinae]OFB42285.1 hypothetical protein Manayef4_01810 [Frankia sp. CgIM4]OHV52249.1 hypothetical protein CgIS1_02680 [Frankia sp. CgIS1]ORT46572.1 hypothetical protein KBI5_24510 [Frankia sp. KB5]
MTDETAVVLPPRAVWSTVDRPSLDLPLTVPTVPINGEGAIRPPAPGQVTGRTVNHRPETGSVGTGGQSRWTLPELVDRQLISLLPGWGIVT